MIITQHTYTRMTRHLATAALLLCIYMPLVAQHGTFIDPAGQTVETRFKLPKGFERIYGDETSFAYYLRHLRMLPTDSPVKYFDGSVKPNNDIYAGVLNIDMGTEGLQQDAQFCMRLRGEYLFDQQQYNKISFTISNRDRIAYTRWVEGIELVVNDKTYWTKSSSEVDRYRTFRRYLDFIFTYSDISTLLSDTQLMPFADIMPGDVLVQAARPGHSVIILDVAENTATGERIYLLAQSYRPTQTPHILVNPSNNNLSPWYSSFIKEDQIITPEYVFNKRDARHFREVTTPVNPPKKKGPIFYF